MNNAENNGIEGNTVCWEDMIIHEQVGAGSYAPVCRVTIHGKTYALKRISIPPREEEGQILLHMLGSEEKAKAYFRECAEEMLEETKILSKLRGHPNIVAIEDYRLFETASGYELDILMEYLESFTQYEVTHHVTEETAIRLGLDLCHALEACEKENILHRDLKPDNILVSPDGTFKAGDFGLAKSLEKSLPKDSVKGSFSFMAPEVYHGKSYDKRADLYSLGIIMYRTVNRGKDPFISPDKSMIHPRDREKAMERRMNGEALPPPADASDNFAEVLLKLCAFYPEKRYSSAAALKKDLLALQDGTYKSKYRHRGSVSRYGKRTGKDYLRLWILGLFLLALLLGAGGIAWYEYQEHAADYCDKTIRKELEMEYGISGEARLNGNGVLTITKDTDLYCTKEDSYPWISQKDRIKKIVFGEEVTGVSTGLVINEADGTLRQGMSQSAFRNCRNLEEIVIKGDAFRISGLDLFQGDKQLRRIDCAEETDVEIEFSQFNDTLWINEDGPRILGNALVRYNAAEKTLTDFPQHIKRIAPYAFSGNQDIQEVILPSGVRVIGEAAFLHCEQLKNITITEEVAQIEDMAFAGCTALNHLIIPGSVQSIGRNAFSGCSSLDDLLVLPENTSFTVKDGALYSADRKELIWCTPAARGTFVIPGSVTLISSMAFADSPGLTRLVIPEGIVDLPPDMLGRCPTLTDISISGSNPFLILEEPFLYYENKSNLILCLRDTEGSITVPEGTERIQEYTFSSCRQLTRIVLPDTVVYIMPSAFADCTALESIELPSSLQVIETQAFSGCDSLKDVYYAGTREEWQALTGDIDIGIDEQKTMIHFAGHW